MNCYETTFKNKSLQSMLFVHSLEGMNFSTTVVPVKPYPTVGKQYPTYIFIQLNMKEGISNLGGQDRAGTN